MKPECSLIISTYNWPEALKLSLQSAISQKILPAEIIIADDGSGESTRKLIEEFAGKSTVPIVHVWHEDNGFRLSAIRNKAIQQAKYDYIIQVDADCLLHPLFVADHLEVAKQGTFVCGTRSMINEEFTNEVLQQQQMPGSIDLKKNLSKKYNSVHNRFLRFIMYLVQRSKNSYQHVKGCNMAFWRKDLLAVNGYNEEFIGWGKEDNDLSIRLMNAGIALRFAKFSAIQYHLHHAVNDLSRWSSNDNLLKQTMAKGLTFIQNGIKKDSDHPERQKQGGVLIPSATLLLLLLTDFLHVNQFFIKPILFE